MSDYTKEIAAYMAQQRAVAAMSDPERRVYQRDLEKRARVLLRDTAREIDLAKGVKQPSALSTLGAGLAQAGLVVMLVWLLSQAGITPFGG